MSTIVRENRRRLTVAQAKHLVIEAMPSDHQRSVDFWEAPDGTVSITPTPDYQIVGEAFAQAAEQKEVTPRHAVQPMITGYKPMEPGNSLTELRDKIYTISHDEFVKFAALFDIEVIVAEPPEVQPSMSIADERSPRERRQDERLRVYEAAGNVPPRNSDQRWEGSTQVAKSLHISRPSLVADLEDAIERRRARIRAGLAMPK